MRARRVSDRPTPPMRRDLGLGAEGVSKILLRSPVRDEPGARPEREACPDGMLVDRAARGEAGAFGRLYQRHVERVFNYVYFRVRDEVLAEDLTHDVFVSALRGLGGLKDRDRFGHWLLRIAHNRIANHWRSRAARPLGEELPGDDEPAALPVPDDDLAGLETHLEAGRVLAATVGLTDLQRQVIALRFVAGLSVAETADVMQRSVGAVKNLQHHGLAALRKRIDRREGGT